MAATTLLALSMDFDHTTTAVDCDEEVADPEGLAVGGQRGDGAGHPHPAEQGGLALDARGLHLAVGAGDAVDFDPIAHLDLGGRGVALEHRYRAGSGVGVDDHGLAGDDELRRHRRYRADHCGREEDVAGAGRAIGAAEVELHMLAELEFDHLTGTRRVGCAGLRVERDRGAAVVVAHAVDDDRTEARHRAVGHARRRSAGGRRRATAAAAGYGEHAGSQRREHAAPADGE
jgi:hypothetical protein